MNNEELHVNDYGSSSYVQVNRIQIRLSEERMRLAYKQFFGGAISRISMWNQAQQQKTNNQCRKLHTEGDGQDESGRSGVLEEPQQKKCVRI